MIRSVTTVLSAAMVVIGVAMIITTVSRGGGAIANGVVLGLLFIGLGSGRIWLERKRP